MWKEEKIHIRFKSRNVLIAANHNFCISNSYHKPAYIDTSEFLQDIAAGEGAPYLEPGSKNLVVEELAFAFKNSDIYKDILRVVYSEDVLHTFWVESEPSLGLTVRTPEPRSYEQDYSEEISSRGLGNNLLLVRLTTGFNDKVLILVWFCTRGCGFKVIKEGGLHSWYREHRTHPTWGCSDRDFYKRWRNAVYFCGF